MALVALAANRSPGLTTTALALSVAWPVPRRAAVAELDPAGGTIAARQVVAHEPGLLSLAVAGTPQLDDATVVEHLQRLSAGPLVLLAPPGPDRAAAALRASMTAGLLERLRWMPGLDVLADCGRVDTSSPALAVLDHADLCVFVARPTTQDIIGLDHRLQTLSPDPERCGLVVIGRRPYSPEQVAQATGLRLLGHLEDDRRGADRLADGLGSGPRSGLLRSAAIVADVLVRDLPDPPAAGPSLQPRHDQASAPNAVPSPRPPAPTVP